MKRIWWAAALVCLASCGVQPSEVKDGGEAPTGLASAVTLYFVDERDELRPQPRETGRLGTISDALSVLLTGPGRYSKLRTEIAPTAVTQVVVTTEPGVIQLLVPLALREVTPRGIDQIVCTALGVHVQGGGPRNTRVRVRFTSSTPESDELRTCPLIT